MVDSCMVAYAITQSAATNKEDKAPIEIQTFSLPCNEGANVLNKNNWHSLSEDFDIDTFGGKVASGFKNVKLSVEAYGDLIGPGHTPVIKIGNDELTVTNTNTVPTDWVSSDGFQGQVLWVASYPCKD
ncbi:hypothetical protein SBOR_5204 [Sclerotinia borealis F-4128]|uniref:Uncharacterized protein n=1 Tax=Sclerotinia borealis (strain F-4128) TaxID=1432307 RepID=W9CEX6_SCLBF|nr:hypothetical protein SBOR_5204 [Sclerotinia borealis F-4128]